MYVNGQQNIIVRVIRALVVVVITVVATQRVGVIALIPAVAVAL